MVVSLVRTDLDGNPGARRWRGCQRLQLALQQANPLINPCKCNARIQHGL
jgi:hypothetical protein